MILKISKILLAIGSALLVFTAFMIYIIHPFYGTSIIHPFTFAFITIPLGVGFLIIGIITSALYWYRKAA